MSTDAVIVAYGLFLIVALFVAAAALAGPVWPFGGPWRPRRRHHADHTLIARLEHELGIGAPFDHGQVCITCRLNAAAQRVNASDRQWRHNIQSRRPEPRPEPLKGPSGPAGTSMPPRFKPTKNIK